MRVYLAGVFSLKHDFKVARKDLEHLGHEVTSQWLDVDDTPDEQRPPEQQTAHAEMCLMDVDAADVLVYFSWDPQNKTRGGRDVEMGYALGQSKDVICIGAPRSVFRASARILTYDNWAQALQQYFASYQSLDTGQRGLFRRRK